MASLPNSPQRKGSADSEIERIFRHTAGNNSVSKTLFPEHLVWEEFVAKLQEAYPEIKLEDLEAIRWAVVDLVSLFFSFGTYLKI